jgi:hypothetical protein
VLESLNAEEVRYGGRLGIAAGAMSSEPERTGLSSVSFKCI